MPLDTFATLRWLLRFAPFPLGGKESVSNPIDADFGFAIIRNIEFQFSDTPTMTSSETLAEPDNVLYRIQRGLVGYVSYLAACEMNEAFSEYILYEPMLRILATQRYTVECEYAPTEWQTGQKGDHKRIDFYATRDALKFAIEVKWAQAASVNVREDFSKLASIHQIVPDSRSFLCVFGKMSNIQDVRLNGGDFKEAREPVYADLKKTKFGCRIYEIA